MIFDPVVKAVDAPSVNRFAQDRCDRLWAIVRIANREVEVRRESTGVTGVQLAERSAALEYKVIEDALGMQ